MRWRLREYSVFDIMCSARSSPMSFKRSLISFVLSTISKGGTTFSGVMVIISFRTGGSVLEDQRSQIHMTITRSVTGIWNAESQTQWFHTTLRSDLLEGDKKILRKCCDRVNSCKCDSSTIPNPVIRYHHPILRTPLRPGNQVIFGISVFY